jgi:hypothetical protein
MVTILVNIMDGIFIVSSLYVLTLFISIITENYRKSSKLLVAYGGCDCGGEACKKIEEIFRDGKRYTPLPDCYSPVSYSKMSYKFCKIYNVSKAEWAIDVSGNNDPAAIWETNEWDEGDALVGFYSYEDSYFHEIIYCSPGHMIYVQSQESKSKNAYTIGDDKFRIPPAILFDLSRDYDINVLHSKNYPSDNDDDDDSDSSSDSSSESEEEEEEEEIEEEEEEEEEDDDDGTQIEEDESDEEYLTTHIPLNQRVIDFLYRSLAYATNDYRREAYKRAINEVYSYWSTIDLEEWEPYNIGPKIANKIRDFIKNELNSN